MLLNEISCESRAQNDQLARNGIAAAPGFTRSQKNFLLLFLLAAIQSEELSACLLTLVNNLIPSTGFQLKLLEYFIHLHPCNLHGYDIAITLVYAIGALIALSLSIATSTKQELYLAMKFWNLVMREKPISA